jgi:hypothetical protein
MEAESSRARSRRSRRGPARRATCCATTKAASSPRSGPRSGAKVPPEELFEKLEPFKRLVAEDIREGGENAGEE